MTIDERLEALTHSVELLAQMHADNERKYERRFQDNERKYERRFERIESLIERVVTVQESLGAIARDHEDRLKGLEG
jgi:hypothetical protein